MQPPEAREFGILKARDHAKDARLLAVFHLGLKTDDIIKRAQRVILPQLHDGIERDACRASCADR